MLDQHEIIHTTDGPMDLYLARPDGAAKGAVVVIQEAFGVTTHIQDVCRRLAAEGWVGAAPSYFHRNEQHLISYDDMPAAMEAIKTLTREGLTVDTEATFTRLNQEDFVDDRIGIVGFCMGGSVALYANTLRTLGAAVTYYGGGVKQGRFGLDPLIELAPRMKAPWLGQFGDLDKGIPPEDVEDLRLAAKSAPVETDIVRYPEAGHAFNCNDRPASYNEGAARDAWRRTLEWFDQHIH